MTASGHGEPSAGARRGVGTPAGPMEMERERSPHAIGEVGGRTLVAGSAHTHTSMSDGEHDPATLVELAHDKGLGVVCITDHHFNDWSYHFLKLRKGSVLQFGLRRYFDAVRNAAAASPGPIVLSGLEIMPHYRWDGIFPYLRCEAMKTIVVFGIDDAAVFENLPLRLDGRGKDEAEARQAARAMIAHLNEHGAITYWSHLEEDERTRHFTAEMIYRPRPELLDEIGGATGFGCFPAGHVETCQPGGRWDRLLARSIKTGAYDGPWVMGESDYHWGDEDAPYANIANPTTVFALDGLDADDVRRALATGRMYAYQGPDFAAAVLREFCVTVPSSGAAARAGECIAVNESPSLEVELTGFAKGCKACVICGGALFHETDSRTIALSLPMPGPDGYACRLMISSPDGHRIMSNPVYIVSEAAK